ncbi:MAG: S41 family peptidase [Bacteroidia bacterium]|nr:S41 family peptidase [Bacteroidia bacterium]
MNRIYFFVLTLLAMLMVSCEIMNLKSEYSDNAEDTFEALWKSFDEHYGGFMVKSVNWDSMYEEVQPSISEGISEEELYEQLVRLLSPLEDPHVALVPVGSNLPTFWGGRYGRIDTIRDFNLDVVKENYLSSFKETKNLFLYDVMEGNVGYVHIKHFGFGEGVTENEFDEVLDELKETKGMIIDLRGGSGGEDIAGKVIASRFADKSYHYMNTRVKAGPAHDDFTDAEQWFIQPEGPFQYHKPVIILTNVQTLSARETFLLAMRVLPNVTQIGDTTAGGFSNANPGELPNGWGYAISVGEWTDGEGVSFEGRGIPPDFYLKSNRAELLMGKDALLEYAHAQLK